jgi:hypothetical protein
LGQRPQLRPPYTKKHIDIVELLPVDLMLDSPYQPRRRELGPLFTWLNTGESSNREVEEFNLHPNQLKALSPQGQGYLLLPDRTVGVSFEMLPRFAVADYTVLRRPPGEGLNLYDRFVMHPRDIPARDDRLPAKVRGA